MERLSGLLRLRTQGVWAGEILVIGFGIATIGALMPAAVQSVEQKDSRQEGRVRKGERFGQPTPHQRQKLRKMRLRESAQINRRKHDERRY